MNPEFKRNLWLELSLGRLIGMAVVLGAIFVIVYLAQPKSIPDAFLIVSSLLLFTLCGLWGTRRAAAAVPEEITSGAWDAQRMSALSAWSFTWSKVLGATAYAWAGGLVCLGVGAVSLFAMQAGEGKITAFVLLPVALLTAQLLSFNTSLALVRKRRFDTKPASITLGHLVGLIGASVFVKAISWIPDSVPIAPQEFNSAPFHVQWYGIAFPGFSFFIVTGVVLMAWGWLGAWRLMRAELQYQTAPWAWPAFTLFCLTYPFGLLYPDGFDLLNGLVISGIPVLMTLSLAYVGVLVENRDIVRYRRLIDNVRRGKLSHAFKDLPNWTLTFPLVVIACANFAQAAVLPRNAPPAGYEYLTFSPGEIRFLALSIPLFLLRDIILAHLLDHFGQGKQRDAAWIIVLILLYTIAPAFVFVFGLKTLVYVYLPGAAPEYLLFPLAEVFALAGVLWWRVKSLETSVSRTVPPTPTKQA